MLRKLLLILRFYYSAMFYFCGAVTVALAWLVFQNGPSIIPVCMLGRIGFYALYLYLWIIPRYGNEFFYYRNLGVPHSRLLGISCGIDLALCYLLLKSTAALFYEAP